MIEQVSICTYVKFSLVLTSQHPVLHHAHESRWYFVRKQQNQINVLLYAYKCTRNFKLKEVIYTIDSSTL